jgi:uncharacterized OB-fold protein
MTTGTAPASGILEATTVVRVAPSGFEAPIVLGAVRTDSGLLAVRLRTAPGDLPDLGTRIALTHRDEHGWYGLPQLASGA